MSVPKILCAFISSDRHNLSRVFEVVMDIILQQKLHPEFVNRCLTFSRLNAYGLNIVPCLVRALSNKAGWHRRWGGGSVSWRHRRPVRKKSILIWLWWTETNLTAADMWEENMRDAGTEAKLGRCFVFAVRDTTSGPRHIESCIKVVKYVSHFL